MQRRAAAVVVVVVVVAANHLNFFCYSYFNHSKFKFIL